MGREPLERCSTTVALSGHNKLAYLASSINAANVRFCIWLCKKIGPAMIPLMIRRG
jgi:hypothetical protein